MTNEEVMRRLENLTLPDFMPDDHRRDLRASLLTEYSRVQARSNRLDLIAWLKPRSPVGKAVLIASAASVF